MIVIASTLIAALVLIMGLSAAGLKKNKNLPNNYIGHQGKTDEDIVEFRRRIKKRIWPKSQENYARADHVTQYMSHV